MHYHMEIIMPPMAHVNVVKTIAEVMEPFNENNESEEASSFQFWDWYQIGGRYSGYKTEVSVPKDQLDAFFEALKIRDVTVSGITFGKQKIMPESQIPMVDTLWREICPGYGEVCPIFDHFGQTEHPEDTCTIDSLPENLIAEAVMIVGPDFDGKMVANYLIHQEYWNGVAYIKTIWDGTVKSAIKMYEEKVKNYNKDYAEKIAVKPEWISVTVDYHA